ncbi:hypothetical protein ALC60_07044 [Trachymyrmex zeteki]|uniref:CCHC-type domain-containing protein n=1 Tax=Mycetomoellerius zeteki TaxID=64791 RepID=A0A151X0Y0_9HYME|nr:hypothetical protein ALC60_07044 [Trachymyrmex zeteki]
MVSRIITKYVGNSIVEVKSVGRNKVSIALNNFEKANSILKLDTLKANNMSASIPAFRVIRTGIIKNVPLDISEETILKEFNSHAKIISARRLQRKVRKDGKDELLPSLSVLIKFQGQLLPRALSYIYVSFPVFPYIPHVLMCFSYLRFGHISADCKSIARCARCGQNRHDNQEDCPQARLPPKCCGQEHLPSSAKCPMYIRQRQVYYYAALENVSYAEARSKFGISSRPFPLSSSPVPPSMISTFCLPLPTFPVPFPVLPRVAFRHFMTSIRMASLEAFQNLALP